MEYIKVFNRSMNDDPDEQLLIIMKSRSDEKDDESDDALEMQTESVVEENESCCEVVTPENTEQDEFEANYYDPLKEEPVATRSRNQQKKAVKQCGWLSDDKDLLQDEDSLRPRSDKQAKATYKRGSQRIRWSHANEKYLVVLWQKYAAALGEPGKKTSIHHKMAEQLKISGMKVAGMDVKSKLEYLTKRYRLENLKVEQSGGTPSSWMHYTRVQKILGGCKTFKLSEAMVESTDLSQFSSENSADINETPNLVISHVEGGAELPKEVPSKKRKNVEDNEQKFRVRMLQMAEERNRAMLQIAAATSRMEESIRTLLSGRKGQNNNPQ